MSLYDKSPESEAWDLQNENRELRKERDELREALVPFVETYEAVDIVHGLNKSARAKLERAQQALANLNKTDGE